MRRNHPKSGNEMQPGNGRSAANIRYWQDRASENSIIDVADFRATPGNRDPKVPSTTRDPSTVRGSVDKTGKIDRLMKGKDDLNHDGSSDYMPGVRRTV